MNTAELEFIKQLQGLGCALPEAVYEKLFALIKRLLIANETTNLTAITDYSEALVKHLYDSLVILNLPVFQNASQIIDVGSGAGFPGIPLAICCPQKQFFSLEATAKKVNFQKAVCSELAVTNHTALWGRAEEAGNDVAQRETYDLVMARALAATATLAELTLPFVKPSGFAVFYKAKGYQEEIESAGTAIKTLGGQVAAVHNFILPDGSGERNIIVIKKTAPTPKKFPRRSGLPQKSPLK